MAIPTKVKRNLGATGTADIKVLKTALAVTFRGGLQDGQTYTCSLEGWDANRPSGRYNVTLDKTNSKVQFLSPSGRQEPFLVKFLEFGNRGTMDIPEPKLEEGGERTRKSDGQRFFVADRNIAIAKLVVVEEGPYEGLSMPYKIPYIFAPYPGTTLTQLEGTKKENEKVVDFLKVAGMDLTNDEIPFSVNVLPWLESRLQHAGTIFTAQLNEAGFIDRLVSIPSYLLPDNLQKKAKSNGGKAAAKKPAKKSAK